jgi:hypothetical protein
MSLAVKVKELISGQSDLKSRSSSRKFVRNRETLGILVEFFGAVFVVELDTAGGATREGAGGGACSGLLVLAGVRPSLSLTSVGLEERELIMACCQCRQNEAQGA